MTNEKLEKLNGKSDEVFELEDLVRVLNDALNAITGYGVSAKVTLNFTEKDEVLYFYEYYRSKWIKSKKEFEEME